MGQACCHAPPSEEWVGTWVAHNVNGRISTVIISPNGCFDVIDIGPCTTQRHKCCSCYWREDGFGCAENCFAFRVSKANFAPPGGTSRLTLNGSDYVKIGPPPSIVPPPAGVQHAAPVTVPPTAQYVTVPGSNTPQVTPASGKA